MNQTGTEPSAAQIEAVDETSHGYNQALTRCQKHIDWYKKTKKNQRYAYQVSQILTIILSGITPILILVGNVPAVWQAVPPAVVTIIIALNGVFQWKENYLRFAYTEQALESEKIRFETRSSKEYGRQLNDATALDRFVTRVDTIAMAEVGEWRALMQEATDTNTDG